MCSYAKFVVSVLSLSALSFLWANSDVVAEEARSPVKSTAQFLEADDLERAGQILSAVPLYQKAAKAGQCNAALRLSQLYRSGHRYVDRDYLFSLYYGMLARP
jgi:TPR repeat protein